MNKFSVTCGRQPQEVHVMLPVIQDLCLIRLLGPHQGWDNSVNPTNPKKIHEV